MISDCFKYLKKISDISLLAAILGAILLLFRVISSEYFIALLSGIMTGIYVSHMFAFFIIVFYELRKKVLAKIKVLIYNYFTL